MYKWIATSLGGLALGLWAACGALAAEAPSLAKTAKAVAGNSYALDTMWVLIAAFLVIFMQPGFAMLEAGFTRAKNACNILAKNFMDFGVASIMFLLIGYAFMFGEGNGFIGLKGFGLVGASNSSMPVEAFWLFQAAFCGTAATIVSGGMAERTKFTGYLVFSLVISALIYPIIGHWVWGGGWLSKLNFFDFAGSSVVHGTGGWAALAGTLVLGPRIGKYGPDGRPRALAGHNMPLAALGAFILWFGWFGFNPGSQLAANGLANAKAIALIAANTSLAACAGAALAMLAVWMIAGKPDLSMIVNGALAGLVAITAPCAVVSPLASVAIGALAGIIVVLAVLFFDRLKVDDPVGAISVHGVCGMFGTLAVGIWGQKALGLANNGLLHGGGLTQLGIQALGTLVMAAFAFVTMLIVFGIIAKTAGLRVSPEEELRGLDIGEHGMEAYADFQIFTTK